MQKRVIEMSLDLIGLCRTGRSLPAAICLEGVPDDARIIGCKFNAFRNTVDLLVEAKEFSDEFGETTLGGELPRVAVVFGPTPCQPNSQATGSCRRRHEPER